MSTLTQTVSTTPGPRYAFLSRPPPPQKKRPVQPLPPLPPVSVPLPLPKAPSSAPAATAARKAPFPTRRRSSTFSAISSWALAVQPGSPAPISPRSPRRRPSVSSSRRPSLTRRRPSISHSRAPSGSFLHLIDTPTTASFHRTTPTDKDFDLTNLGYTTLFVHMPNTPSTPSPFLARNMETSKDLFAHIPIPPVPTSPAPQASSKSFRLKRLASFGGLKPLRTRSKSVASNGQLSPTRSAAAGRSKPPSPTKSSSSRFAKNAKSIAASKKAKYAHMAKSKSKNSRTAALPPTLANELLLMQFADGGSIETHAKRVMESQAKQTADYGSKNAAGAGVGDVFRDEKGNMWWDQDEEWEYAHLLGGEQAFESGSPVWVSFGDEAADKENAVVALNTLAGDAAEDRRGSVSTQNSELDAKFIVEAEEADDGLAMFGSALTPLVQRKPAMSVLALPGRSKRAAVHLRKGITGEELEAFSKLGVHQGVAASTTHGRKEERKRGAARRRPAPLKIAYAHSNLRVNHPDAGVADTAVVRQLFLEDSFAPSPIAGLAVPASAPATTRKMVVKKAPSRMNVRGLFFGKN